MKRMELLEKIRCEVMQRERPLDLSMKLKDIEEWDSLANISIIALYDHLFNKLVKTEQIRNCITVNDLINLVSECIED